uniref:Uncharacterized protein n=1 Tax=Vespula pensylvanica TaxID=30213 RepID=A0A834MXV4_VESPE|nr:hypothetical protein H0235_018446 [Vespula pensylvanica]
MGLIELRGKLYYEAQRWGILEANRKRHGKVRRNLLSEDIICRTDNEEKEANVMSQPKGGPERIDRF